MKSVIPWVGSTKKSAKLIAAIINAEGYNSYAEPMFGSGAVFFELRPMKAYVGDIEPLLVNMYKVIKENPIQMIQSLRQHDTTKEYFLLLQKRVAEMQDPVDLASAFFYLMTVCYNGIFRSKDGILKLTFGDRNLTWKKRFPQYVKRINSASIVLRGTQIHLGSYESFRGCADITFFDPPWFDSLADYSVDFDHERFASSLNSWRGKWILTINRCEDAERLFLPIGHWHKVLRPYYTISPQKGRKHKEELLICNFEPELFCG